MREQRSSVRSYCRRRVMELHEAVPLPPLPAPPRPFARAQPSRLGACAAQPHGELPAGHAPQAQPGRRGRGLPLHTRRRLRPSPPHPSYPAGACIVACSMTTGGRGSRVVQLSLRGQSRRRDAVHPPPAGLARAPQACARTCFGTSTCSAAHAQWTATSSVRPRPRLSSVRPRLSLHRCAPASHPCAPASHPCAPASLSIRAPPPLSHQCALASLSSVRPRPSLHPCAPASFPTAPRWATVGGLRRGLD